MRSGIRKGIESEQTVTLEAPYPPTAGIRKGIESKANAGEGSGAAPDWNPERN